MSTRPDGEARYGSQEGYFWVFVVVVVARLSGCSGIGTIGRKASVDLKPDDHFQTIEILVVDVSARLGPLIAVSGVVSGRTYVTTL